MAIPTNIKTLLSGDVVEWARIEFKETWDSATSLKTVCAFANDLDNWGGGYVVRGVEEESGRPVYPLKGVPKNETSFETSLKQVLKQKDYKKLESVIAKLAKEETISIQEVMELTKKSRTTAWRYMQILVGCGGGLRPESLILEYTLPVVG